MGTAPGKMRQCPPPCAFTFHRFFVAEDVVLRPRGLDIRGAGNEFPAGLRRLFVVGFVTLNKAVEVDTTCTLWRRPGLADSQLVGQVGYYLDLHSGFNAVSVQLPLEEPLIGGNYQMDTIVERWRSRFRFQVGAP